MKKPVFILAAILIFISLACSVSVPAVEINRSTPGPTQTTTINESGPVDSAPAKIRIEMGAGKLNLQPGAAGLIEGEIRYNNPEYEPKLTRDGDDIHVSQSVKSVDLSTLNLNDYQNDWDLKLGSTPIDLRVEAGAYDGTLDLSGIPLTDLEVSDGASSAEVVFNSPNPSEMHRLTYKTGASSVKLLNLSNANFTFMNFEGGAGSYTLDFSGSLQRDASVEISSGVSSVKIIIPDGINAEVEIDGELNDISTQGTWNVENNIYRMENTGPKLSILYQSSLGSLTLIHQ